MSGVERMPHRHREELPRRARQGPRDQPRAGRPDARLHALPGLRGPAAQDGREEQRRRPVLHAARGHPGHGPGRSIPRIGETVYDPGCGTGGFLAQAFEYMRGKAGRRRSPADQLDTLKHEHLLRPREGQPHLPDRPGQPRPARHRRAAHLARQHADRPGDLRRAVRGRARALRRDPDEPALRRQGGQGGADATSTTRPAPRRCSSSSTSSTASSRAAAAASCSTKACCSAPTRRPSSRPSASCWTTATSGASSACPRGVFIAAGAGVKTNLLFFTKGRPTETIWYYDLSDVKVGKKTPLTLAHFEDFFRLLPDRADSERSWTVTPGRDRSEGLRPQGGQPERQEGRGHSAPRRSCSTSSRPKGREVAEAVATLRGLTRPRR